MKTRVFVLWLQMRRESIDELTCRRQLQKGKGVGEEGYNGMVDCFRKIIKNEGASRLYRGINAPILMEAPKRYSIKHAGCSDYANIR